MRSASDRRSIGLAGLLGAIALVGASCARVHIEPGTGTGGDGGDSGHGGAGGAAGGRGGADSGSGGSAGAGGSVGGAIGGGGSGGGGTAGSAGAAGRGGTGGGSGGTAGSAGAGGRGGTGGGGTGGTAGSGGSAGSGGTAGSAGSGGTAGSGGAGGRGGSGGTAGSAGTGGVIVPMGTTPSVAGQIVITELMHNTTTISDDTGEWIEVYNPSATVTYDLLGCEVSDTSPPGDIVDANLVLPPMTFKTMAVSAAPGFTPDYVYTPVGVAPVVKFDNQGGDGAQLRCGGVLIDEFTYPSTVAPNAGHSFSVDPDHYNTIDNDSMANWCNARDTMPGDAYETSGPNYGTPGRANTQCP